MTTKTFVLDTNALIYNPKAIYHFGRHHVVLPLVVLEEIDNLKTSAALVGETARRVHRELEKLRVKAHEQGTTLAEGVQLEEGGTFMVWTSKLTAPSPLSKDKADNQIIATVFEIKMARPDEDVTLISKDINVRLKCDSIGIKAEDFKDQLDITSELYTGIFPNIEIPNRLMSILQENGVIDFEDALNAIGKSELIPTLCQNMYGTLTCSTPEKEALVCLVKLDDVWHAGLLKEKKAWGIGAMDNGQHFALDALLDPDINLVTISGVAGSGKTLFSLAAALEQTEMFGMKNPGKGQKLEKGKYRKIVISRPTEPFHKDIGFLPGDLNSKLDPWLTPIWDNLEFLFKDAEKAKETIQIMRDQGLIEVRPLTFMRGASIRDAFIIMDEVQNITRDHMKTILTRVGMNSKLVMLGDVEQIDNQHLDRFNNGLSVVSEMFKQDHIAAHITLTRSQRSPLAALAVERFG